MSSPSKRSPPRAAGALPNPEYAVTVRLASGASPIRRAPVPVARRFYQIWLAMVAETLVEADLTSLQYGVLVYLSADHGGEPGIDQNGLAARLGVDRNNASLLVEELAKRGLVERRINGADRRARQLYLTAKGEKLFARLRPANLAANARILEPLAPRERELLLDLLIRVIEANGAYARPGAGRRKRRSQQQKAADQGRLSTPRKTEGERHV
jgi:DNA-binding MarR family transcriptional regulator